MVPCCIRNEQRTQHGVLCYAHEGNAVRHLPAQLTMAQHRDVKADTFGFRGYHKSVTYKQGWVPNAKHSDS